MIYTYMLFPLFALKFIFREHLTKTKSDQINTPSYSQYEDQIKNYEEIIKTSDKRSDIFRQTTELLRNIITAEYDEYREEFSAIVARVYALNPSDIQTLKNIKPINYENNNADTFECPGCNVYLTAISELIPKFESKMVVVRFNVLISFINKLKNNMHACDANLLFAIRDIFVENFSTKMNVYMNLHNLYYGKQELYNINEQPFDVLANYKQKQFAVTSVETFAGKMLPELIEKINTITFKSLKHFCDFCLDAFSHLESEINTLKHYLVYLQLVRLPLIFYQTHANTLTYNYEDVIHLFKMYTLWRMKISFLPVYHIYKYVFVLMFGELLSTKIDVAIDDNIKRSYVSDFLRDINSVPILSLSETQTMSNDITQIRKWLAKTNGVLFWYNTIGEFIELNVLFRNKTYDDALTPIVNSNFFANDTVSHFLANPPKTIANIKYSKYEYGYIIPNIECSVRNETLVMRCIISIFFQIIYSCKFYFISTHTTKTQKILAYTPFDSYELDLYYNTTKKENKKEFYTLVDKRVKNIYDFVPGKLKTSTQQQVLLSTNLYISKHVDSELFDFVGIFIKFIKTSDPLMLKTSVFTPYMSYGYVAEAIGEPVKYVSNEKGKYEMIDTSLITSYTQIDILTINNKFVVKEFVETLTRTSYDKLTMHLILFFIICLYPEYKTKFPIELYSVDELGKLNEFHAKICAFVCIITIISDETFIATSLFEKQKIFIPYLINLQTNMGFSEASMFDTEQQTNYIINFDNVQIDINKKPIKYVKYNYANCTEKYVNNCSFFKIMLLHFYVYYYQSYFETSNILASTTNTVELVSSGMKYTLDQRTNMINIHIDQLFATNAQSEQIVNIPNYVIKKQEYQDVTNKLDNKIKISKIRSIFVESIGCTFESNEKINDKHTINLYKMGSVGKQYSSNIPFESENTIINYMYDWITGALKDETKLNVNRTLEIRSNNIIDTKTHEKYVSIISVLTNNSCSLFHNLMKFNYFDDIIFWSFENKISSIDLYNYDTTIKMFGGKYYIFDYEITESDDIMINFWTKNIDNMLLVKDKLGKFYVAVFSNIINYKKQQVEFLWNGPNVSTHLFPTYNITNDVVDEIFFVPINQNTKILQIDNINLFSVVLNCYFKSNALQNVSELKKIFKMFISHTKYIKIFGKDKYSDQDYDKQYDMSSYVRAYTYDDSLNWEQFYEMYLASSIDNLTDFYLLNLYSPISDEEDDNSDKVFTLLHNTLSKTLNSFVEISINPFEFLYQYILGFFAKPMQLALVNKIHDDISSNVSTMMYGGNGYVTNNFDYSEFTGYGPNVIPNKSRIHSLIMGGGKTSMITPLVILRYIQTNTAINNNTENIYIVLPENLVNQSASLLTKTLSTYFPIHVKIIEENRDSTKQYTESLIKYNDKLFVTNVYVMSDKSLKCAMLNNYKLIQDNANKHIYLFDEIDTILNPIISELNYPINKPVTLNNCSLFFDILFDLLTAIFVDKSMMSVIDPDDEHKEQYSYGPHFNIITMSEQLLTKIRNFSMKFIVDILHTHNKNIEISDHMTSDDACLVYMVHIFINEAIPIITTFINRKNYGTTHNHRIIVPFTYAEVPKDGSQFSNPIVIMCLTIIDYLLQIKPMPLEIFSDMLTVVLKEYNSVPFEFKRYTKICEEYNKYNFNTHIDDLVDYKQLLSELDTKPITKNMYFIRLFVKAITLKDITFEEKQLNVSGLDLVMSFNFKNKSGFTGTPSIPNFFDSNDESKMSIVQDDDTSSYNIMSALQHSSYQIVEENANVRTYLNNVITQNISTCKVLIDIGAILIGLSYRDVYDVVVSHYPKMTQFICWNSKHEPIQINSLGETPWTGIMGNEIFYYYDNQHTTGIDAIIPRDFVGMALLGKNSRYRDVVQGIFRMRKLKYVSSPPENEQRIKFIFTQRVFTCDDMSIDALINWFRTEEEKYIQSQQTFMNIQNIRALFKNCKRIPDGSKFESKHIETIIMEKIENKFLIYNNFSYPIDRDVELLTAKKTNDSYELNGMRELFVGPLRATYDQLMRFTTVKNMISVVESQKEQEKLVMNESLQQKMTITIKKSTTIIPPINLTNILDYNNKSAKGTYVMYDVDKPKITEYYELQKYKVQNLFYAKNNDYYGVPFMIIHNIDNTSWFVIPYIEGIKLLDWIICSSDTTYGVILDTYSNVYYSNSRVDKQYVNKCEMLCKLISYMFNTNMYLTVQNYVDLFYLNEPHEMLMIYEILKCVETCSEYFDKFKNCYIYMYEHKVNATTIRNFINKIEDSQGETVRCKRIIDVIIQEVLKTSDTDTIKTIIDVFDLITYNKHFCRKFKTCA